MLVAVVAVAALLQAQAEPEPEPRTLYEQALGCAASATLAKDAGTEDESALFDEILTWGLVMGEYGPRVGRSKAQIDDEDIHRARTFFAQMQTSKPAIFAAHRAYCRAFLP